ncbi:MAG: DUF4292 domain-containing protein [Chitinophagaceae bacterium]|uniref:DUF4292 domain-containing protein n=1 Tax=unclassified Paraflavitalea TaxID=2798305 RepID=UPI003D32B21B|nr:DUF4292 domain-containing protein [Chitinophagaceae bacterium]
MKQITSYLILLAVATVLYSCRSTKKIQNVITTKIDTVVAVAPTPEVDLHADSIKFISEAIHKIDSNRVGFKTFSAKVKVNFEDKDGKKNDFNAFIRLKKDSILWIKIDAVLGIEAFRVIVTPDSVKVLNKLDKVVQYRAVSGLQELSQLPFGFKELQNLIIGDPVYLDTNVVSYKKDDKSLSLYSFGNFFKQLLSVNPADYTLQNCKLDDIDPTRARTCLVIYGEYQKKNNQPFSTFRKITVQEKSKLDIEMEYKQFDFDQDLSFPFSVPRNYKKQ